MMADKDPKIERTVTLTTSDDDMLLETPPDEEVTHDLDNKGFAAPRKRRLVIVLGFAAILLILAMALTVFFVLVKKPSNVDDGGIVSNTPTRTPVTGTSPISVPTASLTPLPTPGPTASPTPITPATPTAPPTADPKADLKRFVNQVVDMAVMDTSTLKDPTSPQYLAREWLIHSDNGIWASTENGPMMAERYAMAVLDIALAGELSVRTPTLHVCDWLGVECEEISEERIEGVSTRKQIRQINWARRGLTGSLPEEIVLVQEYLWKLDLAENDMIGALPEMFYSLTNLTHVYLHNNRLSGAISESGIANMPQLVNVYFGHNQFTGTIPSTWASIRQGQFSKPLRYLILHHNKFSGQIPTMLNWDRMFYMDLGNNDLTGSIPADIEGWWDLRHLYLNSNKLSGSIPSSFGIGAGNGRIIELDISDNQLTGEFPGDWGQLNTMVYMDIKGNAFGSVNKDVCKMEVLDSGEMVEFQADCDVCLCESCAVYC